MAFNVMTNINLTIPVHYIFVLVASLWSVCLFSPIYECAVLIESDLKVGWLGLC